MKSEEKSEKEKVITDADGIPIREGSVLQCIEDDDRGVVTDIQRVGKANLFIPMIAVGDLVIKIGSGITRITNRYKQWRHIPHDLQTYQQRFDSWLYRIYDHESQGDSAISLDEGLAIDGIMSLLPEGTVNWEEGPWPDEIGEALRFLVAYLEKLDSKGGAS